MSFTICLKSNTTYNLSNNHERSEYQATDTIAMQLSCTYIFRTVFKWIQPALVLGMQAEYFEVCQNTEQPISWDGIPQPFEHDPQP